MSEMTDTCDRCGGVFPVRFLARTANHAFCRDQSDCVAPGEEGLRKQLAAARAEVEAERLGKQVCQRMLEETARERDAARAALADREGLLRECVEGLAGAHRQRCLPPTLQYLLQRLKRVEDYVDLHTPMGPKGPKPFEPLPPLTEEQVGMIRQAIEKARPRRGRKTVWQGWVEPDPFDDPV